MSLQFFGSLTQWYIALDRDKLPGERKLFYEGTQILSDLSFDFVRVRNDCLERTVLLQPLGSGLGSHIRYTRDVVDTIADQREIIDHAFGRYTELFQHSLSVIEGAGQCVYQGDVIVDDLCHVFVTGRDHRIDTVVGRLRRKRSDHVVGLDAFDHQQRQTQGAYDRMDGLYLHRELVRHRRAVGLVIGIDLVAKGLALGVEYHGDVCGIVIREQLSQHVGDNVDRARRLTMGIG